MTRGTLSFFLLIVMVATWLGYLNQINKIEIMTLKEENQTLKTKIEGLKSMEKALLDSLDQRTHQIMLLQKENNNLKTMNGLLQDKVALQIKKNGQLIKLNYDGLKQMKDSIDSLLLLNLEEQYDGQSRKPAVPEQRQDGAQSTGD
jgi:predicted nuclease with TOPRIM domain